MNTLASRGIINGKGDGKFDLNASITRAEFATMAVRFLGIQNDLTGSKFSDVTSSDWFYNAVMTATKYGWIAGYNDGTFRGNNKITRAEVVTIVNRMTERVCDKTYVDNHMSDIYRFSDLRDKSAWYFYDMVEASIGHEYKTNEAVKEAWTSVVK